MRDEPTAEPTGDRHLRRNPLQSRIEDRLSARERQVLAVYRDPAQSGLGRAAKLSIQYALGTGLLLVGVLLTGDVRWYVGGFVAVYAVFLAFLAIRLRAAKHIAGIMPGILERYEARIAELEASGPRALDRESPPSDSPPSDSPP